ncbi:hypothetical protein [Hymenobacter saemangeumensis]
MDVLMIDVLIVDVPRELSNNTSGETQEPAGKGLLKFLVVRWRALKHEA